MIVLGIDPGIARMGWGIIEKKEGRIKTLSFGCLETLKSEKEENRLTYLFKNVKKLLIKFKPEAIALEKLFFSANAKTALTVGQARGIILLLAGLNKIQIASYTPLEIKLAITGYGKADKNQMQKMVQSMLKLASIPKPDDAADALGVAITHCFTQKNDWTINRKTKRRN